LRAGFSGAKPPADIGQRLRLRRIREPTHQLVLERPARLGIDLAAVLPKLGEGREPSGRSWR